MTQADTWREVGAAKLLRRGGVRPSGSSVKQHSFTNGRLIVAGSKARRGKQRRADYLRYYQRDLPPAGVEAKEVGPVERVFAAPAPTPH